MSNANTWHAVHGALPHVAGHEGAIVRRVEQLVGIESPSGDVEASGRIADSLASGFEAAGGTVHRVRTAAGTSLVVDVAGRDASRRVLLIGHSDTVWPLGTLAGAVPLRREGPVLRGPGAFDMKNGLVVVEWALRLLGGAPRPAVRVLITCDEELGSPTTRDLVAEAARGCAAAIGFEAPHPDGALKVGRRGSTRVQVHVTGREAHAAVDPEHGISAIDELVDQLLAVRRIVGRPAGGTSGRGPGTGPVGGSAGRARAVAGPPVLCNVGTIRGGTRANVVPGEAEAEIGLRFVDRASQDRTLQAIKGLAPVRPGALVRSRILSSRTAWQAAERDRAWMGRIAGVARRLGVDLRGRPAAGAGDTNLVGASGVPTVDGFGARGGGAHAVDEHVRLDSIFWRIELLRALLAA